MMFVNKEEVEASAGQKFIEPSVGVPIKKRPFNLNGPSFLQSDTRSLDNLSFTPKHFTPKSLLDFTSSPCSSNDNKKLDSNTEKEKPSDSTNNHSENLVNVVKQEKVGNNCSTDLSLTGNSNPGSSKIQDMESLNCSGRRAALDLNVDLNVAIETWDSTADFAVVNNGVVQNKPVEEPLVKQSSGFNMESYGNIPANLSKNIEKPISGKGSLGDVTLDLQLKLPPRPELRMKNSDVWSSDLSLSLSGKDLGNNNNNNNNTPKSDTLKPDQVRKENSVNNLNVKPVVQKEVTVKNEFNGNLKEKDVQENRPKDQINLASVSSVKKEPADNNNVSHEYQQLGGKLLQRTSNNGIDLNQTASCSNPAVTKSVPIGSAVHPAISQGSTIVPTGDLVAQHAVAKLNASGPVGNLVVQPSIIKSNASVPAGGSVLHPSITTSVPARVSVVQPTITKSKSNDSGNNTSSANVSTSVSLVGNSSDPSTSIEDVKPVISSIPIPIPAISVNIAKQTLPMVSEGMSQGSADMDCSEENHNLPKLAASDKSKEPLVNSIHGSCSSVVSKVPKLEPGIPTEITGKEMEEKQTGNGESSKSLAPSTIPNSVELNSSHNNNENYDTVFGGDANEMPSNCPNLRQLNILSLSNKTKQSLQMDGIGLGSKSRSPSLSGKRDSSNSRRDNNSTSDRENGLERESGFERENCMEREFGSSGRRQFVGEGSNNSSHQFQFQRRFKRNGFGFDRPDFQRKKSRVSQWDEGTNNRPNRGRSQRWEPRRYNKFDGDMIEEHNEDMGFRPGPNNRTRPNFCYNNKNNNNRFNNNRNKSRGGSFKFTRQNSNNSDMSFPDESNRRTGPRPCLSRFQSRRRLADVSPREADDMDSPVFDHPNNNNNNHYNNNNSNSNSSNKRVVDHGVMCSRDRSFSPLARRGSRHWTPPVEMLSGHDEMVRSPPVPNRRPFYNNNKDCTNRRLLSSNNNRQLHRNNNNNNNTRRFVGPASGGHFEPPMHFDGDVHYHHVRYCSDDGDDVAFSDGGAPPVRGRNRANNNNNGNNNMRNQEEYRYNKRGGPPHGWRDGNNNTNSASNNNNDNNNNNNNNGDKLKRRRY